MSDNTFRSSWPRRAFAVTLAAAAMVSVTNTPGTQAEGATLPAAYKVNFQPSGAPVPSGYKVDSGMGFTTTRGYGWVAQTSATSKSLTDHAFDRNATTDQRVDTLMHMQTAWRLSGTTRVAVNDPARWEHALPSGRYDVTVSAGDSLHVDGSHVITVEGVRAIDNFRPTSTEKVRSATVQVSVTDGRLTLDSAGGVNTKVNYVTIVAAPPPNRPPLAMITPAQTVVAGAGVTLSSAGSTDPDGDALTWSWLQTSGTATPLTPSGSSVGLKPTVVGTYGVQVTVTDARGATATASSTVTATAPPTTARGDVNTSTAEPALLADPNTLWLSTFDNTPDWRANWGIHGEAEGQNLSLTSSGPARNGNALRIFASGQNDGYTGYGSNIRTSFDRAGIGGQDEAYLRYYVYLPATWNPYVGGKLPSLAGISPGMSPFSTSSGDNYTENSWWGGVMWAKPGDGNGDHTQMQTYIYARSAAGKDIYKFANPDTGRLRGINVRWRANPDYTDPWNKEKPFLHPVRGQWNMIKIRYKMNTPGQTDGIYQAWLNGQLGADLRDVMYRTNTNDTTRNLDINQMMFANFYGGPTSNTTNQEWFIDDVVISRGPIGPRR